MAGITRASASHVLVTLLDSLQCVRWIETTHTHTHTHTHKKDFLIFLGGSPTSIFTRSVR